MVRSNRSACAIREPARRRMRSFSCAKRTSDGKRYNLVGFQTRLTWPAQKEAFGKLPGLANAEWLRLGVMHRNTFIDSPRLLDATLQLRGAPGYTLPARSPAPKATSRRLPAAAMAGIAAARRAAWPAAAAGSRRHRARCRRRAPAECATPDFQPANVTWTCVLGIARQADSRKALRRGCAGCARSRAYRCLARMQLRRFCPPE